MFVVYSILYKYLNTTSGLVKKEIFGYLYYVLYIF